MKKRIIAILFIPALCGSVLAQNTPSAEEVMDKYLAAIGGKDFLKTINDLTVQISAEREGNAMLITRKQQVPNKFSQTMSVMGMEIKMVSDGNKFAMSSPRGSQTVEGKEAQQAILPSVLFPELRMADLGVKSTVAGTEKVDNKDAYKVTHTSSDGAVTWTDYYDVASGLKVQTLSTQKSPRGEMQQTVHYADYKDFKGLKYPTAISQGNGQFQMQMTVEKVKINDGVKESEFKVQ